MPSKTQRSSKQVSQDQALRALKTLCEYGRQAYKPDAKPGFGQCVGMALARTMATQQIITASAEALEDHNAHSRAAEMRSWL